MKKIKDELAVGTDIDIHIESKEQDDGSVKMIVDFDLKTERAKKIFENNPKLIKKAILKRLPLLMRIKSKLGGYPKIRVIDEKNKMGDYNQILECFIMFNP